MNKLFSALYNNKKKKKKKGSFWTLFGNDEIMFIFLFEYDVTCNFNNIITSLNEKNKCWNLFIPHDRFFGKT